MAAPLRKPFSTLVVLLLVLTCLSVPAADSSTGWGGESPPATLSPARPAAEPMPDGLMSAFLAASAQPFEAGAAGYHARAGGLDFSLRASGLQVDGAGLSWGLALRGFGRGEEIAALPQADVVQGGGRLECRRGALVEWYRATALGVEQGFTIHEAPDGAGPLVLQLEVPTGLAGALDAGGRGLSFAALGGPALRYDHLRAWDAGGAPLDAEMRYVPGQVTIRVRDQGAAYPLTIDPLVYLEQKVVASGDAGDQFGVSVALSGDTALVGAWGDDVGTNADQGSAYVFVRSGTTWSLQQVLTAADGAAEDGFGYAVALSGDTALVGAPQDDVGSNGAQGSAYVFTRSGTEWTQQAQLTAADGAEGDQFGHAVALSGNTALAGASADDVGANEAQGSAYVFTRSGTIWTQQAKLTYANGAAYDLFGASVALSGDSALVGAPMDDVGTNTNQGAAYVFTRNGTTWTRQVRLAAGDAAAEDQFGYAVALVGDTALVGARYSDVGTNEDQGAAYVFTRSGTAWTQQAHLTAADGAAADHFGYSVALTEGTALVGSPHHDAGVLDQGAVYVFTRGETAWSLQQELAASDGAAGDWFGVSAAVAGDTALVGAYLDDVGANEKQGSAYVFARSGTAWNQRAQLTASDGEGGDGFGVSVALSGDTALVGVDFDTVGANKYQGSAYVFARSGMTWSFQQKLTAADGAAWDWFGSSVALSGDTALVGAPYTITGPDDDPGAAYVFVRSGTEWTQQAKLTATDGEPDDSFGYSVALAGDTALVGAYWDDVDANERQGSAYVFTRSGTTWTQQAKLTAAGGVGGDRFGSSVALAGGTALVGAPHYEASPDDPPGAAYVFTRSGTTWTQQAKLTAADGTANDRFGYSVALSGATALVGAPHHGYGVNPTPGSAYVFTHGLLGWHEYAKLTEPGGTEANYFGYTVALAGDMALVGAYLDDVGANNSQGSAYVFGHTGTAWSLLQRLTASDGEELDAFGNSVALSGDTALVGAHVDNVGRHFQQGSAYFYELLMFTSYLPLVSRNAP